MFSLDHASLGLAAGSSTILLLAYTKPCTTRLSPTHVICRLQVASAEHVSSLSTATIISTALSIPLCPAARVLTIFFTVGCG